MEDFFDSKFNKLVFVLAITYIIVSIIYICVSKAKLADLSHLTETSIQGSSLYLSGNEVCVVVPDGTKEDIVAQLVDAIEHSGYGNITVRVVYDK